MANETQLKFGYPGSVIAEYGRWCVLLRPAQATLGALVLVCTEKAQAFSELSTEAFSELGQVVGDAEQALKAFRPYDKINYLMLMMVDPDVHFHVLPRYAETQEHGGNAFPDPGWPGPPELGEAVSLPPDDFARLADTMRNHWPETTPGAAA